MNGAAVAGHFATGVQLTLTTTVGIHHAIQIAGGALAKPPTARIEFSTADTFHDIIIAIGCAELHADSTVAVLLIRVMK